MSARLKVMCTVQVHSDYIGVIYVYKALSALVLHACLAWPAT